MSIYTSLLDSYRRAGAWSYRYFDDLVSLLMRLLAAKVFINSGLLKWRGWFDFDEQQYDLFLYEFFCPDPPRAGALQLCDPNTLDYVEGSTTVAVIKALTVSAGVLEVALPIMLIVGLFTRIGALGLIGMTLFIQLAVFPTLEHWWNPAAWWALVLLAIAVRGPGLFSLDRLFGIESKMR